jgi:hypothetical protein
MHRPIVAQLVNFNILAVERTSLVDSGIPGQVE